MFTWLYLFDVYVRAPSYCSLFHFHFLPLKGCTCIFSVSLSSPHRHWMAKTSGRCGKVLDVRGLNPHASAGFFFVNSLQFTGLQSLQTLEMFLRGIHLLRSF